MSSSMTEAIDAKLSECSTLRSSNPAADICCLIGDILKASEKQKDGDRLLTLKKLYPYVSSAQLGAVKRFYTSSAGGYPFLFTEPKRTDQEEEDDRRMAELTHMISNDSTRQGWTDLWMEHDRSTFVSFLRSTARLGTRGETTDPVLFEAALLALTLRKKVKEETAARTKAQAGA